MFKRNSYSTLLSRVREHPGRIQVISGPRQVGKTTMVHQVMETLENEGRRVFYFSADLPAPGGTQWIELCWNTASLMNNDGNAVIILDEVQKVPNWSEAVKKLWDLEKTRTGRLSVVLLGSSPLLMQAGLTESLAGRFEVIRLSHWDFSEMKAAFGFSLDQYLVYGGYPGAADLIHDFPRYRSYILDSLIETSISRDILMMNRVEKPILLRNLFMLACRYPCQTVSYTKMLGQLQDAGNTTTLAHYLHLLESAGLIAGIQKYSGSYARKRASSPKLLPLNTSLVAVVMGTDEEALANHPEIRGRLAETSLGGFLYRCAMHDPDSELGYWKAGDSEVDFTFTSRGKPVGIECYGGEREHTRSGINLFRIKYPDSKAILVGRGGLPLEEVLSMEHSEFLEALSSL
jgi:predicted AAA+ superfamily ATPase